MSVQQSENDRNLSLLIYIPCHTDFKMALNTIAKIRNQDQDRIKAGIAREVEIQIALSVNGAILSPRDKADLQNASDHFTHFTEDTGGDVNIGQGYLKALEIEPSYLWILSVNEFIVGNAISNLLQTLVSHPKTDIFIANSYNRFSTFELKNIFVGLPEGMSTGLISGVVYKYSSMKRSFSAGPRLSWTGWGQLAVIQYGCLTNGTLILTEFPDSNIYEKPVTFLNQKSELTEFEFVRTGYAHSFFGMVLLIYSLFPRDVEIRNKAIRSWLYRNWYKISYFKIGTQLKYNKNSPQFDSLWVQSLALGVLRKSGFRVRVITGISLALKPEKLRQNPFFAAIRSMFPK